MRSSQNYRWVSQPRQFPGQQLDRVSYCDQPQALEVAQPRKSLAQSARQIFEDVFKAWNFKRHGHSWE